jgi:hypothetical protein
MPLWPIKGRTVLREKVRRGAPRCVPVGGGAQTLTYPLSRAVPVQMYGLHMSIRRRTSIPHMHTSYTRVKTSRSIASSTNAMPVLQSPQLHHNPLPLSELKAFSLSNTAVCSEG